MNDVSRGYKAKTIKAILARKFGEFLASIEDEGVRAMVQNNTVITAYLVEIIDRMF